MAARKRRTELNEGWRDKIRASMLINRLMDHVDGKGELSQTQLRAAEILLKKVAPDLKAIEQSVEVEGELRFGWDDPHSVQSENTPGEATSKPE